MPYWVMHKLESRLPGEININKLIYADDTTLTAESERREQKNRESSFHRRMAADKHGRN